MLHQPKGTPLHFSASAASRFPGNAPEAVVMCAGCAAKNGGGLPMGELDGRFRSEDGWVNTCPLCGVMGPDSAFVQVMGGFH